MNNVYIAKKYESIREAIEHAQVISRVTKTKTTLNFNNVVLEISANTDMQKAIDSYLHILDRLYREQKTK